jgi:hypothetical protein
MGDKVAGGNSTEAAQSAEEDDLRYALREAGIGYEREKFIPRDAINEIMTYEAVLKKLFRCVPSLATTEREDLAKRICIGEDAPEAQSSKKCTARALFAILVLCRLPEKILELLEAGLVDADLPLQRLRWDRTSCQLARKGQPDSPLQCFVSWPWEHVADFSYDQASVLSPFFSKSHQDCYLFDGCVPLPIIMREINYDIDDDHTIVECVKIHPAHHDFGPKDLSVSV